MSSKEAKGRVPRRSEADETAEHDLKRSATEVLRRGFDSTLANWPLILIRIAEGIVFVGIVIAAVVAAVVSIAVAAGLSKVDISRASHPARAGHAGITP